MTPQPAPDPITTPVAPDRAIDAAPAAVPAPPPAPPPPQGREFAPEVAMLYRVAACAGDAPIPEHLADATAAIEQHCKQLNKRKDSYRNKYVARASEFIAKLRPAGLPRTVVYPFGGGDLVSVLIAFPDMEEVTTMSLEHAGDPRRIVELNKHELKRGLGLMRQQIGGMLSFSNNTSKNLSASHDNPLPGQLILFLIGLDVHDMEPVSVRYFTVEPDGSLRYLDDADIANLAKQQARNLDHDWVKPNFSRAFSNVEIQFRARGAADAPVRIHRHMAANLANRRLAKTPGIMAHLNAKGRISAMTKAASYLIWDGGFSDIRDYLLANMAWMISDSTGIPPSYARKAGMEQITYGRFDESFLGAALKHNRDFQALWKSQEYRPIGFRFGYMDAKRQYHLLITRPARRAE